MVALLIVPLFCPTLNFILHLMTQESSRALPVWLISTLVGAVMVTPVAAYLALRHPPPPVTPPPAVVVSVCQDVASGVRRAAKDLEIEFDISEPNLVLDHGGVGWTDNPLPGHVITVKNRGSVAMYISRWHLDDLDKNSKFVWPMFSEHVEERDVHNAHGGVVGEDHWGIWERGKRWRFVKFAGGLEEVGYPPTPANEAQLFDQVISSACFSAGPGR